MSEVELKDITEMADALKEKINSMQGEHTHPHPDFIWSTGPWTRWFNRAPEYFAMGTVTGWCKPLLSCGHWHNFEMFHDIDKGILSLAMDGSNIFEMRPAGLDMDPRLDICGPGKSEFSMDSFSLWDKSDPVDWKGAGG
jgi:hypothetical protein